MIRRGALLTLLLAGCSGGEPGARQDTASAAASNLGAEVSGAAATQAAPAGGGGGLRAQVSDLNADVSGLNTRVTDQGLVIDLPADALFDFDQATLTPAAEAELRKAADVIRGSPAGTIRVIGHTDAKGDDAYNRTLSEARATTVRDWFAGQVGVRQRTFEVAGRGEAEPVAPNTRPDGSDDPAGRTKNRRVEVIVPAAATG